MSMNDDMISGGQHHGAAESGGLQKMRPARDAKDAKCGKCVRTSGAMTTGQIVKWVSDRLPMAAA